LFRGSQAETPAFVDYVRGERRRWIEVAQTNARQTLLRTWQQGNLYAVIGALKDLLDLGLNSSAHECF